MGSSQVLINLGLLVPEKIQSLYQSSLGIQGELKMAAGAESASFTPIKPMDLPQGDRPEGKILEFKRLKVHEVDKWEDHSESRPQEIHECDFSDTELHLWQIQMAKKFIDQDKKPQESYERSIQLCIVKTKNELGKTQTKVAKTEGVLLDKKSS